MSVDLTLVWPLIEDAKSIGFSEDMGNEALAILGGHVNADEALQKIIERNWLLEIQADPTSSDVQAIVRCTLESLPAHDKALFRNRAIAARNAEKRMEQENAAQAQRTT